MTPPDREPSDLEELRGSLDGLDELPISERGELFEASHAALVHELNALDEVS